MSGSDILVALALVLVLEGFALALFPAALRQALEVLARLGEDQQRSAGFVMIALGLGGLWLLT